MMTENENECSIGDLTPPFIYELLDDMGGGMVQSVLVAVEVLTANGHRHSLTLWDSQSSISTQIGLSMLMGWTLEQAAKDGLTMNIEDPDE